MRIVAGSLGGRNIASPKSHRTHPMSERARGALFNTLGDITGLTVLDAFTGSGALSLEAVSRGANHATAVDIDKKAALTASQNVHELNLQDKIKVIRANTASWSDNNPHKQYDIVLLDPPHDDLQLPLIQKLAKHVTKDGLLVLSWPGKQTVPGLEKMTQLAAKNYGDMQIAIYRPLS